MSHQEKSILAALMGTLLAFLIYAYITFASYYANTLTIEHTGRNTLLLMCACVIAKISLGLLFKRLLPGDPEDEGRMDERDKMIELNGLQASYATFTVGFVIAMLCVWAGVPAILALNLIISSLVIGELVSGSIKLHQYKAGA